jgi:hypothetical protein
VSDILLDRRTLERPFLDKRSLRVAVEEHLAGKRSHTSELNKALSLELTMRTLIERGLPSHHHPEVLANA